MAERLVCHCPCEFGRTIGQVGGYGRPLRCYLVRCVLDDTGCKNGEEFVEPHHVSPGGELPSSCRLLQGELTFKAVKVGTH